MSTASAKNTRLLSFMIVLNTSICLFLNIIFTQKLRQIYGDLPWELITRPALELILVLLYALNFWSQGRNKNRQYHRRPQKSVVRNTRTALIVVIVLFWLGLNLRVAIALTSQPVGQLAFETSRVVVFSCDDKQWSLICPARNGTIVFGILGALLSSLESFIWYKIDNNLLAESVKLGDAIEVDAIDYDQSPLSSNPTTNSGDPAQPDLDSSSLRNDHR